MIGWDFGICSESSSAPTGKSTKADFLRTLTVSTPNVSSSPIPASNGMGVHSLCGLFIG
jgi:hypothetical protein